MVRTPSTAAALRAALALRLRALGRERGSATVELVIAVPALLLLLLFVVQFGLIWSAQHAAQTAASTAVNAARAQGASQQTGQAQGETTLQQIAGGQLPDASISVSYSATTATVVVTGHPQSLIPGFHPQVTAHVSAPIETFTQP